MPEKRTIGKARKTKRAGKAATALAGELVRVVAVGKIRRGARGVRSPQRVVAIALSKPRRAGGSLPPPARSKVKTRTRTRTSTTSAHAAPPSKRTARRRPGVSRAASQTLKKATRSTASRSVLWRSAPSRSALSRQASRVASRAASRVASGRTARDRSAAARKAARTKGAAGRSAAARKAARTRARNKGQVSS